MFLRRGVVDLNAAESSSASLGTSVASPVTWHVAVWILISLAINSMAQPSGRICGVPYRYRLYLSSSPILCAVDAFSAIIRLITTSICFRISPPKACYLVAVSRFEGYVGAQEENVLPTPSSPALPSKPHPGPMSDSWPRYLFFVIGTLPAAIKLASFTGNPGTKACGFMFPASFNIIELILLLSRRQGGVTSSLATDRKMGAWNWGVPVVLDLSREKWLEPENKSLRTKTASLRFWLKISDGVLFALAIAAHLIVLGWALEMIWRPAAKVLNKFYILNLLSYIACDMIIFMLIISICVWIGMRCRGYNTQGSFLNRFIGWLVTASMIWIAVSPDWDEHLRKSYGSKATTSTWPYWNYKTKLVMMPSFYLWVVYYTIHCIMDWLGRCWPAVTEALLIEQTGWRQSKELTEQVRSEALPNKPDGEEPEGPVDDVAFCSLFFFLTNLGVCLRWYAVVYDSIGTVNPGWTDVFGR